MNNENNYRFRFIIYLLLIAIVLVYSIFKKKGVIDYFSLKVKYEEIVKENELLKKENTKLSQTINLLKNDKSYIEKIAREKFNMIGDGELLIKINNKEDKR